MKKRIISAIVAVLILVPLVIFGGIPLKILFSLLGAIAMYEIIKVTEKKINYPETVKVFSYISMFLYILLDVNIVTKLIIIFLMLSITLMTYDKSKFNIENLVFIMFTIMFVGTIFSYFVSLREIDINIFICLFLVTICTDTFAFFGGKLFGKHKLLPKVSPNKTIEGSIVGSLIGTVIPSIYYIFMVDPGRNIFLSIIMILTLSLVGQLGDLFFSSIKRYYDVKDYSNIMPGHGGVLDRLDSIIFVVITYALLMSF